MGRLFKDEREKMKILYDHQIFTLQKFGGISRYFYELIREFEKIDSIQTKTSLLVSDNHYISDKNYVKHINFLPDIEFRGKQRLLTLINKPNTILELKKQNFDIFHPTYYDPYFLQYIGNKPFVLTVHDMIYEKFKDIPNSGDTISDYKKLLVEKAFKIITVSQSTKKDLIELFETDESKIEVVYHGNSMFPKSNISINITIPKKYLLFVGSRVGYKNFDRFIKSVSILLNKDKELSVVCTGGGNFKLSEIQLFEDLGISHQIFQYDVDDDKLAYIYKNALVFVFPSLYEGFGIPILEAFACGCPLVCSNAGSLPEIATTGASYFDPYSEESIRSTILQVLNNFGLREKLVQNGTKRLECFSWKFTAEKTMHIYKEILNVKRL